MKKDLNKLSFQELKKQVEELDKKKESVGKTQVKDSPYIIGENYLIRTITMIYTGKLENVYDKEFVISSACWIADAGRWAEACEKGTFKEVEPYPKEKKVIIGKGAISDMFKVNWELPSKQK